MSADIETARLLIDVLRDAIEHIVHERAKRRLLLLVDAVDSELAPLTPEHLADHDSA